MVAWTTVPWKIDKWLDSGYFLKVESIVFSDGVDMG